MKYSPQLITDCVRETFSSPAGQVTLEWLRDLYINYRSQSLVQSPSPNLPTALGYRLGSQDVVLMIEQTIREGITSVDNEQPQQEEEVYE